MDTMLIIAGLLMVLGAIAGGIWWRRRPVPGPADICALGQRVYDAVSARNFHAYKHLFIDPSKLDAEPYHKGLDRLAKRIPTGSRYDGLLVEDTGKAFLRVSLPTGSLVEIQVGKVVRGRGYYWLANPIRGGAKRDHPSMDDPTARPVILHADLFGRRMDVSADGPPTPIRDERAASEASFNKE